MSKPAVVPKWRALTGITVENEEGMEYSSRHAGLGRLLDEVELLFRIELDEPESKYPERCIPMWDPILKVCFLLGISRAQLSRYSREYNGLGIHEFYDAIRIEKIKPVIAERMAKFLKTLSLSKRAEWNSPEVVAKHCFETLRRRRREDPARDRNQMVQSDYNFPNYTRYRKACLAVYRRTPQQLEYEALLELVAALWKKWQDEQNATKIAPEPSTTQRATFFTDAEQAETDARTKPREAVNAEIAA